MEVRPETKKRIAELISIILNPVLMVVVMLATLSLLSPISFPRLLFIMLPFFVSTIGYVAYKTYISKESDLDLTDLKSRRYLGATSLAGLIISSGLCYLLYPSLLPIFLNIGLVISIAGTISLFWKVSFHAIGFSSLLVSYLRLFGPISLVLLVLFPILFWARLELKKHTLGQLITGSLLGLIFLL